MKSIYLILEASIKIYRSILCVKNYSIFKEDDKCQFL